MFDARFSTNGTVLATASGDETLRIWDVATGQQLAVLGGGHIGTIRSARFGADGWLISAGDDDSVVRWDVSALSGDVVDTACAQAGATMTDEERAEYLNG